MARMKVFLRYLIIFILIYIIFDFFTYRYLVNSYKNIKTYEIAQKAPEVKINEAKATAVNGYVKGTIKNNTGEKIEFTNMKIDLYNSRGSNMETKYCKIENFEENQTVEFNVNFRASNISHIKVSFTNENVDEQINKEAEEFKNTVNKWIPIVGLVTLICL